MGETLDFTSVDMRSRFTVSVIVVQKKPSEKIDKIMRHWVGAAFGVMQAILTDIGGEFLSDEMREMASILNVEVCTTAAESPFQNGLCVRIHSVTDMMLAKLEKQCSKTPKCVVVLGEYNQECTSDVERLQQLSVSTWKKSQSSQHHEQSCACF